MPPVVHRFDPPERFVAGTVGEPGQRTFFLQARSGTRVISVALEKQQVQILVERVDQLLDEVLEEMAGSEEASGVPWRTPADEIDAGPLEQPIVEEFRAGTITLSWDSEDRRVVIEVFPVIEVVVPLEADEDDLVELDIEEPEPAELLLVRLTPAQARGFASRGATVVSAGRPQCQFCGGPVDPDGHLCPRANGFRRSA